MKMEEGRSRWQAILWLKVTTDLRGCPPVYSVKKFVGAQTNYISSERLINVDFRKKYELPVFLIPQKKIAKMSMRHSGKQMN